MAENPPPNVVPPLQFSMNADKSRVTVTPTVPGSFDLTAEGVDMLIRALVAGRAGMRPAREPYAQEELGRVITANGMHTRLQPEEDGSGDMLFGLFHPGLGWLGTHFNKAEVETFANGLHAARARNLKR